MLTEDYVIRMINYLLAALGEIIGFKTAGQYLESSLAIDRLLMELFNLNIDVIRNMDDNNLIDALTNHDVLDVHRLMFAADVFKEEGDIFYARDNLIISMQSYLRAINLYLAAALNGSFSPLPDPVDRIDHLVRISGEADLPEDILVSLFCYYEQLGRYTAADDILTHLLSTSNQTDDVMAERRGFYTRLLEKTDAELVKGGMTRTQLEAKLSGSN